jgi:hypothetical protein
MPAPVLTLMPSPLRPPPSAQAPPIENLIGTVRLAATRLSKKLPIAGKATVTKEVRALRCVERLNEHSPEHYLDRQRATAIYIVGGWVYHSFQHDACGEGYKQAAHQGLLNIPMEMGSRYGGHMLHQSLSCALTLDARKDFDIDIGFVEFYKMGVGCSVYVCFGPPNTSSPRPSQLGMMNQPECEAHSHNANLVPKLLNSKALVESMPSHFSK